VIYCDIHTFNIKNIPVNLHSTRNAADCTGLTTYTRSNLVVTANMAESLDILRLVSIDIGDQCVIIYCSLM